MPRWRIVLPIMAALLGIAVLTAEAVAAEAPFSRLVVPVASFGCTLSHGQLVCGIVKDKKNKNKNKNKNMDNQGNGQMQGQVPCPQGGAAGLMQFTTPCRQGGPQNSDVGSQGERACPPGYVVLDKANKYGAFCEPKEGFPTQAETPSPAQNAADACKKTGLKYAGGDWCVCGVGSVNANTGLAGAHPGDTCVSTAAYNAAKAPVCCTGTSSHGLNQYCTPKSGSTEAELRRKLAGLGYTPANITCVPQ